MSAQRLWQSEGSSRSTRRTMLWSLRFCALVRRERTTLPDPAVSPALMLQSLGRKRQLANRHGPSQLLDVASCLELLSFCHASHGGVEPFVGKFL